MAPRQAQEEATAIQAESAETKTRAAALRDQAAQLDVQVADTEGNIAVYELKVRPGGRVVSERVPWIASIGGVSSCLT